MVLFAIKPVYRGATAGSNPLAINAMLNFDHLDARDESLTIRKDWAQKIPAARRTVASNPPDTGREFPVSESAGDGRE